MRLTAILLELRKERDRAENAVKRLDAALTALGSLNGARPRASDTYQRRLEHVLGTLRRLDGGLGGGHTRHSRPFSERRTSKQ